MMRTELAKRLERAGKTQRALAEELGVSQPAVNQWVRGQRPIPPARQVQIDTLLGEKDVPAAFMRAARADLVAFYESVRSPMAFLLGYRVPDELWSRRYKQSHVYGTQEYAEWALGCWSRYLGLREEELLEVAARSLPITLDVVVRVFTLNYGLTYLGEHLGQQVPEKDQVTRWMQAQEYTFGTFKELADAAARELPGGHKAVAPEKGKAVAEKEWHGALPPPADRIYEEWRDQGGQDESG